ncbi:MAG: hypothetical protein KGL59_05760 [Acidobacteriota bacterium]|nr:hypothetical protein [Acidobacteriota bacterium]
MRAAEDRSIESEIRAVGWIRDLARPYLKGFDPALESSDSLHGYRFSRAAGRGKKVHAGFFAGFLIASRGFETFEPAPPECVLFAYVGPPGSVPHKQLVAQPGSLFRSTHEYISWLTHHPPRFQFSASAPVGLVRHLPVSCWPEGRRAHYAKNFLIEGMAWLVRSGLVRRLAAEAAASSTGKPHAGKHYASEVRRTALPRR